MADQSTDTQMDGDSLTRDERGMRLIRDLLTFIGEKPDREGLVDTPKRVMK